MTLAIEFAAGGQHSRQSAPRGTGPTRVLWVDADSAAIDPGLEMLRRHGFEVTRVASAAEAQAELVAAGADLVILETSLPDADGLSLCRRLSEDEIAPVLVVSACADTLDRVAGLEFGADDYLSKSTHPLELLARVRALLRRAERHARRASEAQLSTWRFDAELGYVTSPAGRTVRLSPADAALLSALAARPGEVLGRDALLALLHDGDPAAAGGRSIDARVARLRRALAPCNGAGELIKTLRGGGYLFQAHITSRARAA